MNTSDDSENLAKRLEQHWETEKVKAREQGRKPAFLKAFHKAFCCRFITFTAVGVS